MKKKILLLVMLLATTLTTGCFSEGNSGTPIYLQNTVYGLLIGNTCLPDLPDKVFYNFIDARYIGKIIAETANT